MAQVIISSARHDEFGKLNGAKGDQLQRGTGNDFTGEVSMQPYYLHKYGWDGFRFKKVAHRHLGAERAVAAANNPHLGYSQKERGSIWKDGIDSKKDTNCDCTSLEREIICEATGIDPGNFTTATAKKVLMASGLFEQFEVKSESDLMTGDILCSKKKGHIVTVVLGKDPSEPKVTYYPKYTGKGTSIVSALATVGEKDTSMAHRKKIAAANGITGYAGTVKQNTAMVKLIKKGKLIKA